MKVTGQTGDPTANDEQSETAMSVQTYESSRFVTVTYNDMTDEVAGGFIEYAPNLRRVYRSASLLGWSVSSNDAQTFDYGGKVRAPPGWAVIWGDPAITSSRRNQSYVYIQNLAVSEARFPPIGTSRAPSRPRAQEARASTAGASHAPVTRAALSSCARRIASRTMAISTTGAR